MLNYSSWQEKSISTTKLRLDDRNPRLSHMQQNVTQNELINEMIDNYKVYELARSIAEDGFFPDKNLIAIIEKNGHIVLEGNRRLAALKTLLTPDIVTGRSKSKFKRLNTIIDENYILKIKVIIAPSRESANPIVFKEHTERTVMPWSRIMQAEFYKRQLKNEISLDELASKYNKTKPEITSFLKLMNMYDIACNLEYSDDNIKLKLFDKQRFNASVLERIYDSQIMRDSLKFDFDSSGYIRGTTKKEDFKKAYTRIIEDIVEEKINTRTLNKKEDFEKYAEQIIEFAPTTSGKFNHKDLIKDTGAPIKISITKKSKTKRSVQQTSGIIPRGIPFTLEGATNLKYFYDELKKLSVKSYPNSVATTLRAFLEKSIRMFLKKKNIRKLTIIENGEKLEKKLEELFLGDIIDCVTKREMSILEDNTKKILRQFKSASDKASLNALNSIMHNEEYSLREDELRRIWSKLECVFREILLEP